MKIRVRRICVTIFALFFGGWSVPAVQGYSFNMIVPDVRQPASVSGG